LVLGSWWIAGFAVWNVAEADDYGGPPPVQIYGPTSSPIEPPKVDDRTFVVNEGPDLDTGCTFVEGGPLLIQVPVTRYAGPTDAGGHLLQAQELVDAGLLSEFAVLTVPAYDVDYHGDAYTEFLPERDRVFFNGSSVKSLYPGNSDFLRGSDEVWRLSSFRIPIEHVRFPTARGSSGQPPTPALNEIRIDIDVLNPVEGVWCTTIDWAALSIKAMSPIILIHGNSSDGGFFVRQGFTAGLNAQHLIWDNSITIQDNAPVPDNAIILNGGIPEIVTSYGVDSAHLVTHSKGGLDARAWLADYYGIHADAFNVLSLTTMSTPHNGSVLADIAETWKREAKRGGVAFPGFPAMTALLNELANLKEDPGRPSMETKFCADFNARNLPALDRDIAYHVVAADADLNGNGEIDVTPDESFELRIEDSHIGHVYFFLGAGTAAFGVDRPYQILRYTKAIDVTIEWEISGMSWHRKATVHQVPNPAPLANDVLVTLPSGLGTGSFDVLTTRAQTFQGTSGRNHASIANVGVANTVAPWIIAVEQDMGDLK
jgi:pimeloyl-ACP methyl ester carboxylesterase